MTTEPAKTAGSILDAEHRRVTIGIVATIAFIAFEAMAVATAMPRAVRDLNGLPMYAWAFSGFFTTSLFAMVLSGEICDRRGPRLPIVIGASAFTAGLLVAGTAQSMWPFVAGRAVQGFGAGLQFCCNALKGQLARLDLRSYVRAEDLDRYKPPLMSKAEAVKKFSPFVA